MGSLNTQLLKAAQEIVPSGSTLEIATFEHLPFYNQDLEQDKCPDSVSKLRRRVIESDGIIWACPEYNHSVPGGLKNAIDWLSRPAFRSPLAHKHNAIISAAGSPVGGARAQAHLKLILDSTLALLFPHHEMLVGDASSKFDTEGKLTDRTTRDRLQKFLSEFVGWIER